MLRNIVLDTNCLLQIISRHSKNYFLWEGFLSGDYCLCYTTEILEEYEEILCQKTNRLIASMVLEIITQATNTKGWMHIIVGILFPKTLMITNSLIVRFLPMQTLLFLMTNILRNWKT